MFITKEYKQKHAVFQIIAFKHLRFITFIFPEKLKCLEISGLKKQTFLFYNNSSYLIIGLKISLCNEYHAFVEIFPKEL